MFLSLAATLALATACAPQVAPQTLAAIVQVESGFDPLALGVNGARQQQRRPETPAEAIGLARALITAGFSVDLGLAQLNSRNLQRLGLSVEEAFDPCRNLAAAGRLLSHNFAAALSRQPDPQSALRTALSLYNTGHVTRGVNNGYVAKVVDAARRPRRGEAATLPAAVLRPADPAEISPTPAAWDVFARAPKAEALVIHPHAATGVPS